jgi:hypothetical protein
MMAIFFRFSALDTGRDYRLCMGQSSARVVSQLECHVAADPLGLGAIRVALRRAVPARLARQKGGVCCGHGFFTRVGVLCGAYVVISRVVSG